MFVTKCHSGLQRKRRNLNPTPLLKWFNQNCFNAKKRISVKTKNDVDKKVFAEAKAMTKEGYIRGSSHSISQELDDNVIQSIVKTFNDQHPNKLIKFITINNKTACCASDAITTNLINQFDGKLPFETIDKTVLDLKKKAAEIFKQNQDKQRIIIIALCTINCREEWTKDLTNAPGFKQFHSEVISFTFINPEKALVKYFEPNGHFKMSNNSKCMFFIYIFIT